MAISWLSCGESLTRCHNMYKSFNNIYKCAQLPPHSPFRSPDLTDDGQRQIHLCKLVFTDCVPQQASVDWSSATQLSSERVTRLISSRWVWLLAGVAGFSSGKHRHTHKHKDREGTEGQQTQNETDVAGQAVETGGPWHFVTYQNKIQSMIKLVSGLIYILREAKWV